MAPKRKLKGRRRATGGYQGHRRESTQSERDGGHELLLLLLRLYSTAKLSALELCQACYFANKAGTPGASFSLYGLAPGHQTGKYQALLDRVLPEPRHLVGIPTPGNYQKRALRTVRSVPARCVWETIEDELEADSSLRAELDGLAGSENPIVQLPVYRDHPVVVKARLEGRPLPMPLAYYLDGVQFRQPAAGRNDSVLGVWCINMLSQRRHLISTLKNSDACQCGCRGWCNLYQHHLAARWMFASIADGARPQTMPDGSAWTESCPVCWTQGSRIPEPQLHGRLDLHQGRLVGARQVTWAGALEFHIFAVPILHIVQTRIAFAIRHDDGRHDVGTSHGIRLRRLLHAM